MALAVAQQSADPNYYEWKMNHQTLSALKKKRRVYSPIFRMYGFSWRLEFEAVYSKWPGNAMCFLSFLSSPPSLSRVDAAWEVSCTQLNVHYSSVNTFHGDTDDSSAKWGWIKGICSTDDAMAMNECTFGVKVELTDVYNKDGEDVLESRIAKSKSLPSKARLSSNDTQTLQSLAVRVDSLTSALEEMRTQIAILQSQHNEDEKENTHSMQQQIDDLKVKLQKLRVNSNVIEQDSDEAIFKKWIVNTLNYPEYHELFVENGVETLNVAKLLTKNELKAMGINKIGHQLKIMEGIRALKESQHQPPQPGYQSPAEGGTPMI